MRAQSNPLINWLPIDTLASPIGLLLLLFQMVDFQSAFNRTDHIITRSPAIFLTGQNLGLNRPILGGKIHAAIARPIGSLAPDLPIVNGPIGTLLPLQ